jgi:hypothetical protein
MSRVFNVGGVDVVHYLHYPNAIVKAGTFPAVFADPGTVGTPRNKDTSAALVARDGNGSPISFEASPFGQTPTCWLPQLVVLGDFGSGTDPVPMRSVEEVDLIAALAEAQALIAEMRDDTAAARQDAADAAASAISASNASNARNMRIPFPELGPGATKALVGRIDPSYVMPPEFSGNDFVVEQFTVAQIQGS